MNRPRIPSQLSPVCLRAMVRGRFPEGRRPQCFCRLRFFLKSFLIFSHGTVPFLLASVSEALALFKSPASRAFSLRPATYRKANSTTFGMRVSPSSHRHTVRRCTPIVTANEPCVWPAVSRSFLNSSLVTNVLWHNAINVPSVFVRFRHYRVSLQS
jgi:hypothetical protein